VIWRRLVRSPRFCWRDSGLLPALPGVRGADELLHQPWVGASWEGFVIAQGAVANDNSQCEPVNRTGLGPGLKALANVAGGRGVA
jgi:hypothetical protein